MKMSVDADRCSGHGRCYALAPALLESDGDGFVTIRGSMVDVPQGSESAARDAAAWCPEGAINILDKEDS